MAKTPPIGAKLPEEYERQRARFLGTTVEDITFRRWYLPWRRWQKEQWLKEQEEKKSSPSDERSQKPIEVE